MTTVPLIVILIVAKVWCPVCVGSHADIFCLRLKELFFLLSFPHYFCLCEVLMDLYVVRLPFGIRHQMFVRITTLTFLSKQQWLFISSSVHPVMHDCYSSIIWWLFLLFPTLAVTLSG